MVRSISFDEQTKGIEPRSYSDSQRSVYPVRYGNNQSTATTFQASSMQNILACNKY